MSTMRINGKTYNIPNGKSISMINGSVYVDGKLLTDAPDLSGVLEIKWDGELASLTTDLSVSCDNVSGDVHAGQHVTCGRVEGSVNANGHVTCGRVVGDVKAGGHVTHG